MYIFAAIYAFVCWMITIGFVVFIDYYMGDTISGIMVITMGSLFCMVLTVCCYEYSLNKIRGSNG
tara:strand:+ start:588 stop:782 length:195 start_codon:yes stop_codon:yes gene_type:complete